MSYKNYSLILKDYSEQQGIIYHTHVCNVGFLPRCHLWAVLSHGLNTYVCISTCVPAGVHTRGTLQSAQFIAGLKKEKKKKT